MQQRFLDSLATATAYEGELIEAETERLNLQHQHRELQAAVVAALSSGPAPHTPGTVGAAAAAVPSSPSRPDEAGAPKPVASQTTSPAVSKPEPLNVVTPVVDVARPT